MADRNNINMRPEPEKGRGISEKFSHGAVFKRLKNIARLFLIFLFVLCAAVSHDLVYFNAAAANAANIGVDAIILLDCSQSMQKNDPQQYLVDGATLLLDQLFDKSVSRYGVIMFTDEIRAVLPLQPLSSDKLINDMKKNISDTYKNRIMMGGQTDSIRAMRRALQEFEQNPSSINNQRMIVLFTDGRDKTTRDLSEREIEMEYVMTQCEKLGIPIYTIGLGMSDDGPNMDLLTEIANKTNAQAYNIKSAKEIQTAISDMYSHFTGSADNRENGKFQKEPKDFIEQVPDSYMLYMNMDILSDSEVQVLEVINPDGVNVKGTDKVYIGQSQARNTTIQITQPEKGKWTVKVRGEEGTDYSKGCVYLYTLRITNKIADKNGQANYAVGNARVEARLATENGEVTDLDIYKTIESVDFKVVGADGAERLYDGKEGNDCWFAEINDLPKGTYEISTYLKHKYFTRDSFDPFKITLGGQKQTPGQGEEKKGPELWQILAIAGGILLVIVVAVILAKKGGGKDAPISGDFEIDISNTNGSIAVFRTGGLFFDRPIKSIPLSNILSWSGLNAGSKEADAICVDIIFAGRKDGTIFKTKRKNVTISSSDARIDGYNALSMPGSYLNIDFNDNDYTRVRISLE